MKALIETTGAFMLFDTLTLQCVDETRPTVVEHGPFLQGQMAQRNITILANELPDEATDAEWAEWLKAADGDVPLATASYVAKFAAEAEVAAAAQAKIDAAAAKAEAARLKAEGGKPATTTET